MTEISLSDQSVTQFDMRPMLDAAALLADARVHAICWNGTSSGWLGFDRDERLCEAIRAHTGIPACSAVLALNEIFSVTGVKRFGLVTPYLDEIQARILDNYAAAGFVCPAERHLGDPGNFSFSEVSEAMIATMCREVATGTEIDAIAIFCTNLRGLSVVEAMESELGIPVYDTVATALWKSLKIAGIDPSRVEGWGRLFQDTS